ncbi:MAG: HAMP domain-containing histidine kinase [Anaerolineae bacterium]|nr:HAMP domain-containing histidine kinase [Anaerolineae bacterium]
MSEEDIFGSDLLSVVAHDLKSPISAVRGYLELLPQAGSLNEVQAKYCARAVAGLDRMEGLITAMLEMSRLEKGEALQYADCDLGIIARSAVDLVEGQARQSGITIHVQIDPGLSLVHGDRRLLGQVINNLLTNAIKYNREQGSIWIVVSNQPDFVRVDIRDNGVGIPEEDQPHIFNQFFRAGNSAKTRASGSGLGLAIVKAIIDKHQGYVWVSSVEEEGSTFSFTVPRKGRQSEGVDMVGAHARQVGEGSDTQDRIIHEASIEESDDIDDNTQESRGSREVDSSSDAV